MNKKWAFVIFIFLILIPSYNFLKDKFWRFYLFRLDATGTTNGVILKSDFHEADAAYFICQYRYSIKSTFYNGNENISINDKTTKFFTGEIVPVTYNIKRPWHGTIDLSYNMYMGFFASIIVFGAALSAVIIIVGEIVKSMHRSTRKQIID
jgi:hypothetical protein